MLGDDDVRNSYYSSYKRKCIYLILIITTFLFVVTFTKIINDNNTMVSLKKSIPTMNNKSIQTVNMIKVYNLPTEYIEDDHMYEDERMIEEGATGLEEITYLVSYENGEIVSKKEVQRKISKKAIARRVRMGTKVRPEFIYPVEKYVLTSNFGPRWGTNHNGIDLAVPTGTQVKAAADGVVVQSGWNGGYGISVYIDHGNGVITRYGHMSETLVSEGQAVKQGEIIGLSGSTGDSTGPHVHFEIRINEEAIDPLQRLE